MSISEPARPALPAPPPTDAALADTIDWILSGHSLADIRAALGQQHPGHDPEQSIAGAVAHFHALARPNPEIVRGFLYEAYRQIYRDALNLADHVTALRALRELRDLTNS